MVSIYRTVNGWFFRTPQEIDYYYSLAEVMDAAYATGNRAADNNEVPAVRDSACHHCRFAPRS
jgi:hypothetical protein